MCRLLAYIGGEVTVADIVVHPSRSIIKQSFDAKERMHDHNLPLHLQYGNINADGFGIGWYSAAKDDPAPCTFKSTTPAWNNENLNRISGKLRSELVFAHVRAAMPGMPVSEQNCHPFSFGRYLFMHNGMVAGFHAIRRQLIAEFSDDVYNAVQSFHVDSAVSFAVFLNQLPNLNEPHSASVILKAMQDTIATIGRHQKAAGITSTSLMNFVVSDGNTLVATRFVSGPPGANPATLYFSEGGSYHRKTQNSLSHLSTSSKIWKKAVNALQVAKFTSSLMGQENSNDNDHVASSIRCGTPNALINEGDFGLEYSASGPTVCMIASEPVTSGAADWTEVPRNTAIVVQREKEGLLSIMHAPLSAGCDMDNDATFVSLQAAADLAVDSVKPAVGGVAPLQTSNHQATAGAGGLVGRGNVDVDTSLEKQRKLIGHEHGVITTCISGDYLFSGAVDGTIKVWNHVEGNYLLTLQGHRYSVRKLIAHEDKLYSIGAKTVRVWLIPDFQCKGILRVADLTGSAKAIAVSKDNVVYVGGQDCRIKAYAASAIESDAIDPPRLEVNAGNIKTVVGAAELPTAISATTHGHCANVNAVVLCGDYVCSASSDCSIKVWKQGSLELVRTLHGHTGGVLALVALSESILVSGGQDGDIRVWDLETMSCRTTMIGHTGSVLDLSVYVPPQGQVGLAAFASASADGTARLWNSSTYQCIKIFCASSPILTCVLHPSFIAGSFEKGDIVLFHIIGINEQAAAGTTPPSQADLDAELIHSISQLVQIRSVPSSDAASAEACFQAAKFLVQLLEQMGAQATFTAPAGLNPVVLARIEVDPSLPTVAFYGHYDVDDPIHEQGWKTDPFTLVQENEYMYGKGVSCNKGPSLACVYAVKEMHAAGTLPGNVSFIFEGEHNRGSKGCIDTITQHQHWFNNCNLVVVSDGQWAGEKNPCLIYGMRGMINISVQISGPDHNLHSGNHGGAACEPLSDLSKILASLLDEQRQVAVPGFYDGVRNGLLECAQQRVSGSNEKLLADIDALHLNNKPCTQDNQKAALDALWCKPSLSIVGINIGRCQDALSAVNIPLKFSVIPNAATGSLCIRFVADQNPSALVECVKLHIESEFKKLHSVNDLSIVVHAIGDSWEADLSSPLFPVAEAAIKQEWGVEPLLIRQGSTLPVVAGLEKALNAPALLLPLGQSSDNCQLANERTNKKHLLKGKNVIKNILLSIPLK